MKSKSKPVPLKQEKMKFNPHITIARSAEEAKQRLSRLGADPEGIAQMEGKMRHLCVKLEKVPAEAARFLKKTMLELGAEAALSSEVYQGKAGETDVILMGTLAQYHQLCRQIPQGPPVLSELGQELPLLFRNFEQERFQVPLAGGETLVLGERPLIMGIVNCTPDSFYDGGRYHDPDTAVAHAQELLAAGADIIDIGGESTRPGAEPVPSEEEKKRVIPVIERLARSTKAVISIDTQKAEVAREAVGAGAAIVNDVSALADPAVAQAAAESGAAVILMHMKGTPRTMQQDPSYEDLFAEIIFYLRERMDKALQAGISRESIIVDPGIGFGKTVAHNLELVRDLWRLRSLGRPILLGPSNKSFIGKVLDAEPHERLEGTAAAIVAGILAGAHILRVHDVAGMKKYVDMAWAIKKVMNINVEK